MGRPLGGPGGHPIVSVIDQLRGCCLADVQQVLNVRHRALPSLVFAREGACTCEREIDREQERD